MELMNPFTVPFWLRMGTAILCGSVIGFERQIRGKPAGIRTSILVCLATQVFVQLAVAIDTGNGAEGPSRVIGQVVTGVGFLGAGVILAREGLVTGVTSAAVIWVLAAVGATIGVGHYGAALATTAAAVAVLAGVELLEQSSKWLRRGAHAVDGPRHPRRILERPPSADA